MIIPGTVITLSIAATLLFVVALGWTAAAVRVERRPPGGWFAVYCTFNGAFMVSRLLQVSGWSARAPSAVAHLMLTSVVVAAFAATFFLDEFFDRERSKLRVSIRVGGLLFYLGLLFGSDLVLTSNPLVRPMWPNGTFVGVETGPLLLPFHVSLMAILVGSGAHAIYGCERFTRIRRLLITGFVLSVAAWVIDVVDHVAGLAWFRPGDYTAIPVVLAYIYSHAERYGELYENLQDVVARKTETLARANEQLRHEHEQREQLMAKLATKERLEALGRLAGGVAHDFNNLLMVLSGSNELAALPGQDDQEREEHLRASKQAIDQAAGIVRQLLDFAKERPANPTPMNVVERLEAADRVLDHMAGPHRLVFAADDPRHPICRIDPSRFDQVILNLVKNARDATEGRGRIRVDVRFHEHAPPEASGDINLGACGIVQISVADEGCGMTDEVKAHIFEPFYSTKGQRGTGLGLATVHGHVTEAGGQITVDSTLGEGTTFHVWLPVEAVETVDDDQISA